MLFYLRIGEQHLILLGGEKRGEVDFKKKKSNERLQLKKEMSLKRDETNLICPESLNYGLFMHF